MTRQQWLECVTLARSDNFDSLPYLSLDNFTGIALDKTRRTATRREVASWIIGHCATFGGTWLNTEERELAAYYPRIDLTG